MSYATHKEKRQTDIYFTELTGGDSTLALGLVSVNNMKLSAISKITVRISSKRVPSIDKEAE